jgi:hypothetical protein
MASYMLYKEKKEGVLSTFPFGAFAYARLDDRLQNEPLWQQAKTEPGRDPMGLTPKQPNIEFFTTEASLRSLAGKSFAGLGINHWLRNHPQTDHGISYMAVQSNMTSCRSVSSSS